MKSRKPKKKTKPLSFAAGVALGMRRAAKTARKVARMHGTPLYFWRDGKVVADKPANSLTWPIAKPMKPRKAESFAEGVGRGLRLAAKTARKDARMYGTPVYFWKNGKVVAEKP